MKKFSCLLTILCAFITNVCLADTFCNVECNKKMVKKTVACTIDGGAVIKECTSEGTWVDESTAWCPGKIKPDNFVEKGKYVWKYATTDVYVYVKDNSAASVITDRYYGKEICTACRFGSVYNEDEKKCETKGAYCTIGVLNTTLQVGETKSDIACSMIKGSSYHTGQTCEVKCIGKQNWIWSIKTCPSGKTPVYEVSDKTGEKYITECKAAPRCQDGDNWSDIGYVKETKKCSSIKDYDGPRMGSVNDLHTGDKCEYVCIEHLNHTDDSFPSKFRWRIQNCPSGTKKTEVNDKNYNPGQYIEKCVKSGVNCNDFKGKHENRYKCCIAGNATKWTGDKPDNGTCTCVDKNKQWDNEQGKCIEKTVVVDECMKKYGDNAEAFACCKLKKEWKSNKCDCGTDQKWEYNQNDKTGACKSKTNVNNTDENGPCNYRFNIDVKCNNGNRYNAYKEYTLDKDKVKEFGSCDEAKRQVQILESVMEQNPNVITEYEEIIKLICGSDAFSVVSGRVAEKDIENAQKTLKKFFANAKENASVWKTESGNFNGTRLASDLTAGVVLGTVGGVVSANVIKKNQIEKGFDVLHCTIGGQTVADWGDEFNVQGGIR